MARSGPRALGAFAPPAPPSRPGAARIAVCAASVGLALIVASPVSPGRATGLPTMLSGHARVVDGDTFVVSGERVRLYAVDAPEMAQVCVGTGGRFKCGVAARERALDVVAEVGDVLDCAVERRDRYGRLVGVCRAGGIDVAGVLVDEGLAFAYRAYGMMYVGREELARQQQRGLWAAGTKFQYPWEFRAERRHASYEHAHQVKQAKHKSHQSAADL